MLIVEDKEHPLLRAPVYPSMQIGFDVSQRSKHCITMGVTPLDNRRLPSLGQAVEMLRLLMKTALSWAVRCFRTAPSQPHPTKDAMQSGCLVSGDSPHSYSHLMRA